ncbi:hypothetical protein QE13_03910 [Salmonella enterica subsp. enterica serovar Senftenberg]|nr:hypothetical protein [Salmonella enterica subsp. enterica serovar Senftenberg]
MQVDTDFISLDTLVATQQAAKWAGVAAIAACISCFATIVGIGVAWRSLHQWKPQYKENSRLQLIDTLVAYQQCLISLPKDLSKDPECKHRKEFLKASIEVDMRGVIYLKQHNNSELKEELENLRIKSAQFVAGKVSKPELALISSIIMLIEL